MNSKPSSNETPDQAAQQPMKVASPSGNVKPAPASTGASHGHHATHKYERYLVDGELHECPSPDHFHQMCTIYCPHCDTDHEEEVVVFYEIPKYNSLDEDDRDFGARLLGLNFNRKDCPVGGALEEVTKLLEAAHSHWGKDGYLTNTDAANVLGVREEEIEDLINAGAIQMDRESRSGSACHVSLESLRDLLQLVANDEEDEANPSDHDELATE